VAVAPPTLLGVAHGTRDPAGTRDTTALLAAVRVLLPDVRVEVAYVELTEPSVPAALADLPGPVVVVPLLLSTGYHVKVDLPRMLAAAGTAAVLAPALGPDPLLAEALHDRLLQAGWRTGDAVILAAAGSSDPAATADTETVAQLLGERIGAPVGTGYASASAPTVAEAVAVVRAGRADRVAVASYLLAAGHFHRVVAAAGADLTTEPLRDHSALARLVVQRYAAVAALPAPAPG
jgi:sirohydrochlorin ferrochelatase